MSDNTTNPPGDDQGSAASPQQQPVLPQMRILGQFIRDLSFENIVAQKAIASQAKPDIQVQVSMDAKKRETEHQYEVICKFKITSSAEDKSVTLFVLEMEYGGVFQVENVPDNQLHPYLLIECPRMLFPYIRRIVSDITQDGGFPALNLENIDFVSLYRQSLAQRQQQAQQQQGGGATVSGTAGGTTSGNGGQPIN